MVSKDNEAVLFALLNTTPSGQSRPESNVNKETIHILQNEASWWEGLVS